MESEPQSRFEKLKKIWVYFFSFVLFTAISINFFEIVLRVLFNYSIDLMYDLPAWLTAWSMILVSGIILLDNEHLCIEVLRSKMPAKGKRTLDFINNILTLIFGATITYAGFIFTKQLYTFNTTYTRIIAVPKWMVEVCVPLGMGIFSICAVIKLIHDIRRKYDR